MTLETPRIQSLQKIYDEFKIYSITCLSHTNINSKNFLIITNKGKFVLHNFRDGSNIKKFERICRILDSCRKNGALVPQPIKTNNGNYVHSKQFYLTRYYQGKLYNGTKKQFTNFAQALAILHSSLKKVNIKYSYRIGDQTYKNIQKNEFDQIKKNIERKFTKDFYDKLVLKNLEKFINISERSNMFLHKIKKLNLNKQLIHFDLHPQNVIFHKNNVAVILDFGTMRKGILMNDIAYASFRFASYNISNIKQIKDKIDNFIITYGSFNKINDNELEYLGHFTIQLFLAHINYILRKKYFFNSNLWITDLTKHLKFLNLAIKIWPIKEA